MLSYLLHKAAERSSWRKCCVSWTVQRIHGWRWRKDESQTLKPSLQGEGGPLPQGMQKGGSDNFKSEVRGLG